MKTITGNAAGFWEPKHRLHVTGGASVAPRRAAADTVLEQLTRLWVIVVIKVLPRGHWLSASPLSASLSAPTVRPTHRIKGPWLTIDSYRCSEKFVAPENNSHMHQYGLRLRLGIRLKLGLGLGVVHKWRHAILRKNLPPSPFVTLRHTFLDPLQMWRHKRLTPRGSL